ncbi:TniQ family protein [Kitasatospora sp. CMC57]|uniref:TniQ family protein n=1 Tax=Kitasatospora sp. CMC57 TaxID=3231513 RepID=A0AB33JTX6_9ACTN
MKPGRTLPLRLAPHPGEALDSYLDALAHRLNVPLIDLGWSFGLKGGPHSVLQRHDIPANRVVLLRDHEAQAINTATGIPIPALHAMTLARYDRRAVMIDHTSRQINTRTLWARGRGSRYCPDCLAESGGRWQIRWRLVWSFACTTHQRMLADTCPVCESIPGFRGSGTHQPPSPGHCPAPISLPGDTREQSRGRHRRCGANLAQTSTLLLPPGHQTLAAQDILDQLIDIDTAAFGLYTAAPVPTATALADLRAIAGRVLAHTLHHGLLDAMATDPVTVELHRLARHQHATQRTAQQRVGTAPPLAAGAALGLTHAVGVMAADNADTAAKRLRWLTSAPGPDRRPTHASTLDDWGRSTSDTFRRIQLAALGPALRPNDQLRYRVGAVAPTVRLEMSGALARARRRSLPSTFWPAWTARLLPRRNGHSAVRGSALAASILLVGTRLNHTEAAELLGGVVRHWPVTTTLQRMHASPHWDDIRTALTALADRLDAQPSAIDYERRRHLDYTDLLPDPLWESIRQRIAETQHTRMLSLHASYARHLLFTRLSGLPPTCAPFPHPGTDDVFKFRLAKFAGHLTPRLTAELDQAAQDFLALHQIRNEPIVWQPPAELLDGLTLPGPDPAGLDLAEIHRLVRTDGASPAMIARHFETTSEAIQALLIDHPAPQPEARRQHVRHTISREQLVDLHHEQRLSLGEIGKLTGYGRTTISDLARTYEIPITPYRAGRSLSRPSPQAAEQP